MPVSIPPPGRDKALDNPLPTLDATWCPVCGSANLCAMEIERATGMPQPPCWCTTVHFDAELLARMPQNQRNLACICATCAEKQA